MFEYLEMALKDDEKSKFKTIDDNLSSLKSDSSLDTEKSPEDLTNPVKGGEQSIQEYDDAFDDP